MDKVDFIHVFFLYGILKLLSAVLTDKNSKIAQFIYMDIKTIETVLLEQKEEFLANLNSKRNPQAKPVVRRSVLHG